VVDILYSWAEPQDYSIDQIQDRVRKPPKIQREGGRRQNREASVSVFTIEDEPSADKK
jgi:hypothetical protein